MGLFGVYLVATIIILVNLLIAMMNTTINTIHNKKVALLMYMWSHQDLICYVGAQVEVPQDWHLDELFSV